MYRRSGKTSGRGFFGSDADLTPKQQITFWEGYIVCNQREAEKHQGDARIVKDCAKEILKAQGIVKALQVEMGARMLEQAAGEAIAR